MQSQDSLTVIDESQWTHLIDVFVGPECLTARVAIKAQIFNKKHFPDFPVEIFAPYNQVSDGVVIFWNVTPNQHDVGVYCPKEKTEILIKAVKETKRIDWNKTFLFCSVVPHIVKFLFNNVLSEFCPKKLISDNSLITHVSNDVAESFEIIDIPEIEFKMLGPECAEEINEMWKYKHENSVQYFRNILNYGQGYGIVGKTEQDLRGWLFISARGDLHSLHIKDEYRRKGYAEYIVKKVCKILLDRNMEIFGCVSDENIPSKNFFMKLGFKFISEGIWYYFKGL